MREPSTLLEWALWAIEQTPFYVFPLVPNGKDPITSVYNSTRDPEKIKAWWSASPDCNIGYAYFMSGHSIVDIDVKDLLKNGLDTWDSFIKDHGSADTLVFRTMSGGFHRVYDDPDGYLPNKARVWPGIDCRSRGGYGVGLGSVVDGKCYEIAEDLPIAPLPDWLKQLAGNKTRADRIAEKRTAPPGTELDTELAIIAGREAIEHELAKYGGEPHDGDGSSDQRAWELCARLLDFALSESVVLDLLKEHWAPHFDTWWLREKFGNAASHRTNEIGCDRPQSMSERAAAMGESEQQAQANFTAGQEQKRAERDKKYPFRSPREDAELADIEYWDDHRSLPKLPGGCAVVAYGPMSSHKTGVVLKYCLDAVEKGAKVLYLAPEGAHGIRKARLPAAMRDRGGLDGLTGRWYTFSTTPGLSSEEEIAELIEACDEQGFKPDIVVIDTLTRAARGLDISAPQTGVELITGMEIMAAEWDATVIAVTHPGKDMNRGAIGSSLVSSLAYAVWEVFFDGESLVTAWVEKMKDGPQEFGIEFDVQPGAAPVLKGGTRTETKPRRKKAGAEGKETADTQWAWVLPRIREQLALLKQGETINTTTLATRIKNVQGAKEGLQGWFRRKDNFARDLRNAVSGSRHGLRACVELDSDGQPQDPPDYLWRLPPS